MLLLVRRGCRIALLEEKDKVGKGAKAGDLLMTMAQRSFVLAFLAVSALTYFFWIASLGVPLSGEILPAPSSYIRP